MRAESRGLVVWAALAAFAGCHGPESAPAAPHGENSPFIIPEFGVGLCQSPINIRSAATPAATEHEVHFDYKPAHERITHKAHTVQIDWEEGSTLTIDGAVYDFRQLHFHTPSEHLVDGVTYPMEVHLVHTGRADPETYLVVSLLFKEGAEHAFLADFLDDVPEDAGGVLEGDRVLDLTRLRPADRRYFNYDGSLTTPPYTETVRWFVISEIQRASSAQIERIAILEGNNARHIQALHGRRVERG